MAPFKKLVTYDRKRNVLKTTKPASKKKRIVLKELPDNTRYLTDNDSSVRGPFETTFDLVARRITYQKVCLTNKVPKNVSTSDEESLFIKRKAKTKPVELSSFIKAKTKPVELSSIINISSLLSDNFVESICPDNESSQRTSWPPRDPGKLRGLSKSITNSLNYETSKEPSHPCDTDSFSFIEVLKPRFESTRFLSVNHGTACSTPMKTLLTQHLSETISPILIAPRRTSLSVDKKQKQMSGCVVVLERLKDSIVVNNKESTECVVINSPRTDQCGGFDKKSIIKNDAIRECINVNSRRSKEGGLNDEESNGCHVRNETMDQVSELGSLQEFQAARGKKYRRSLAHFRKSSIIKLENCTNHGQKNLLDELKDLSLESDKENEALRLCPENQVLELCRPKCIEPFAGFYPPEVLATCRKIGEGFYGEVFMYKNLHHGATVIKIVPVEGDTIFNQEEQQKFENLLSELQITKELSGLRFNKVNQTSGFVEIQRIACTVGSYPEHLLNLWELYDEIKQSENDSPQIFPPHQKYVLLELAYGGEDLESYMFNGAHEVYSVFKQVVAALAVAEEAIKFEHRDLHWGNILVKKVDRRQKATFILNNDIVDMETNGVEATVIDFTLSRCERNGEVCYNDLSKDELLFTAQGDYQFDIYRLMRKQNDDDWKAFNPYTNVLWLHYLLDKAHELHYKSVKSKIHLRYAKQLRVLKEKVLDYSSCKDFIVELLKEF